MRIAGKSILKLSFWIFLLIGFIGISCLQGEATNADKSNTTIKRARIRPGAYRTEEYILYLKGKKVALVANHTSTIGDKHLLDSLIGSGINVVKVFSPEHGFTGTLSAGEEVEDQIEKSSQLPIISLYGNHYKPREEDMEGIDIVVFDIQDVGVRFYTYISTLHYIMEACAENNIDLLLLDRPNPNSFYIDGPVMEEEYTSFVGMHPIPLVYGMTMAELARMINGEYWLSDSLVCNLNYVECENYTHDSLYQLPVSPSPNLSTMRAVYLYPSLGLFEGTVISEGRGTPYPFQVFGHPDFSHLDFKFVPKEIEGVSINPKFENDTCFGMDLRTIPLDTIIQSRSIQLHWLYKAYHDYRKRDFFIPFFYNLSGTKELRTQLEMNVPIEEIRQSWQEQHVSFKARRKKYLLYEDFKEAN